MSKANLQERLRHWVSIASPDRLRIVAEAFGMGDTYSQSLAAEMRSLAFMLETTPNGSDQPKPSAAKLPVHVHCENAAEFARALKTAEEPDMQRFEWVFHVGGTDADQLSKLIKGA